MYTNPMKVELNTITTSFMIKIVKIYEIKYSAINISKYERRESKRYHKICMHAYRYQTRRRRQVNDEYVDGDDSF